ncbi:formyltetrahydrofolate-dependent phosphoribosylglycinamide formyltransferase [Sinobacterium caligoides]|uniref:Phosphoribosylglycinamide formyltransferase n=1 Tax=Sinobacterium caligoides TaxID=933926 RepID=A0A3N2DPS3_9GAMM|nr:phosphoribosylglycinamide formyltransferase [Sinobacterium caligoides]ROS01821.1 formyltetrahydrofolate-dependent phosphoribosylglycinamide formyltransferase [Sinobacterium caligoides]
MTTTTASTTKRCRLVVLISGSGSNLQAFIDKAGDAEHPFEVCAVLSNRADAYGLERAAKAGISTAVVDHKAFADRDSFDRALMAKIDAFEPDLVILAGFMRILTGSFTRHYLGRLLNIHPSLLPKYTGLHTHQRALDAGDESSGCTVHFVTEELDGGPPIVQASVPILPGDDADAIAARVLIKEHIIYPMAAAWFSEGRLRLDGECAQLDDKALPATGQAFD